MMLAFCVLRISLEFFKLEFSLPQAVVRSSEQCLVASQLLEKLDRTLDKVDGAVTNLNRCLSSLVHKNVDETGKVATFLKDAVSKQYNNYLKSSDISSYIDCFVGKVLRN